MKTRTVAATTGATAIGIAGVIIAGVLNLIPIFSPADIPPASNYIVDAEQQLANKDLNSIARKLARHDTANSRIGVIVTERARPNNIEQYAERVAEEWNVGDDTVLIVLETRNGRLFIRTTPQSSGIITQERIDEIMGDYIQGYLDERDWKNAIDNTVDLVSRLIETGEL